MESFFFQDTTLQNIFRQPNILINDSSIFSSQLINEEIPLFANINKNTTDPPVDTDPPVFTTIDLEERIFDLEENIALQEEETNRLKKNVKQQRKVIINKNKVIKQQQQQISYKTKIIKQQKQKLQLCSNKRKR